MRRDLVTAVGVLGVILGGTLFAMNLAVRTGAGPSREYVASGIRRGLSSGLGSGALILPKGASSAQFYKVHGEVLMKRMEVDRNRKAFTDAGWRVVEVPKPEEQLENISPVLLGVREPELQYQIQSNTFTGENLDRLKEIAVATRDPKTRFLAIEALGRSHEDTAQKHLITLYRQIPDEAVRGQIVGGIKPKSLMDRGAVFLAGEVNATGVSAALKRRVTFRLLAADLANKKVAVDPKKVSPDVLKLIDSKHHVTVEKMHEALAKPVFQLRRAQ